MSKICKIYEIGEIQFVKYNTFVGWFIEFALGLRPKAKQEVNLM